MENLFTCQNRLIHVSFPLVMICYLANMYSNDQVRLIPISTQLQQYITQSRGQETLLLFYGPLWFSYRPPATVCHFYTYFNWSTCLSIIHPYKSVLKPLENIQTLRPRLRLTTRPQFLKKTEEAISELSHCR